MISGSAVANNDADSDVELEGIDVDDQNENMQFEDCDDDDDEFIPDADAPADDDDDDDEDNEAVIRNEQTYQEAMQQQRELIDAATQQFSSSMIGGGGAASNFPNNNNNNSNAIENRFKYLLGKSEVFGHFLAGTMAAQNQRGKKNNKFGGRGGGMRMTEAEEDTQLMRTAQSKRSVVRVEKQPSLLSPTCKMHDYQLEGLNWLIKLHDHGINGILADEMGLGKTLQTISMLAYLRETRGVKGPHLIVVPKSVVGNWIREFKKWCRCIKAIRMLGTKADRIRVIQEELPLDPKTGRHKFDVLVTSYEGVLKAKTALSRIRWEYLIIDEAQRIKNENSSLSRAVREIRCRFRLLITGTPLQNNLHELWALLNFLLPEIFGDATQFDEWFNVSSSSSKDNVIRKLHTVLRPFMLRRVKKDVACALPPKKETKLYIGLSQMQQQWYTRILRKDAHELNSLGGPDRVRLLNILMQLRKVCNHPYLFDGAEQGPPFSDGPHLWETSGKMMLLHKLLLKLKEKGSRVLIFCQMTRMLDILEDYFRYIRFEYCRIDGNTDGEKRDSQMDDFNAPGSTKFCFLLSTRAGGLGINLATADIVILYDSDWNPQVDLQAIDRAHRIGQTKPVQVFRFITEGTIEEKIIERADRKLFLDAAVIQQGRLSEKHSSVDKRDLMQMVRFGADEILSSKGGTYTDQDIDALIAKGEERNAALQEKLKTDAQHNLANFTLSGADDNDTFNFGGKDFRAEQKKDEITAGNFITLPQRERKRNYDVNEYYRDAMNISGVRSTEPKKRKKSPAFQDFQFFASTRLKSLVEMESEIKEKRDQQMVTIEELKKSAQHAPSKNNSRVSLKAGESSEEILAMATELEKGLEELKLSEELEKEKKKLLAEGFADWSRKDFKSFVASLERHGRDGLTSIMEEVSIECGKDEAEVKRYFIAFWKQYKKINDWEKIIDRVERGEKKLKRLEEIKSAIEEKVMRHLKNNFGSLPGDPGEDNTKWAEGTTIDDLVSNSWHVMSFDYGSGYKGRSYTEEEDAFLVCMMYRHGYGSAERIRIEIRRAWQFRFNWFFKSRNSGEIQKRCDILIKIIERENEEVEKKVDNDDAKISVPPQAVVHTPPVVTAAPPMMHGTNIPMATNVGLGASALLAVAGGPGMQLGGQSLPHGYDNVQLQNNYTGVAGLQFGGTNVSEYGNQQFQR